MPFSRRQTSLKAVWEPSPEESQAGVRAARGQRAAVAGGARAAPPPAPRAGPRVQPRKQDPRPSSAADVRPLPPGPRRKAAPVRGSGVYRSTRERSPGSRWAKWDRPGPAPRGSSRPAFPRTRTEEAGTHSGGTPAIPFQTWTRL